MMASSSFIVGFSGNRPSDAPGRSAAELEAMRGPLNAVLSGMTQRLGLKQAHLALLSSIAEGADTLACELAIDRGIPLRLILPKPIRAFRDDFVGSPAEAWQRALSVIRHAQGGLGGSTLRTLPAPHDSPGCYEQVNAEILAGSQALIVLWNGAPTRKAGGAGEMLRQARERKMPHVVVNTLAPDRVEWIGL